MVQFYEMPYKTEQLQQAWAKRYYEDHREYIIERRKRLYATDPTFRQNTILTNMKWRAKQPKPQKIKRPRKIRMDKQTKKPKSALQLKRERICRNLARIEDRARLFRQKLIAEGYIQPDENAPKTEDSSAPRDPEPVGNGSSGGKPE
jgi:hypothetical protein